MDVVPAGGRLVRHALLNFVHTQPGSRERPGVADVFSAVGEAGEALGSDAITLWDTIGSGMAEAAVEHVPAMEARAPGQCRIPDIRVEASSGPVAINLREQLSGKLYLLWCHGWWRAVGIGAGAGGGNIAWLRCGSLRSLSPLHARDGSVTGIHGGWRGSRLARDLYVICQHRRPGRCNLIGGLCATGAQQYYT